MTDEVSAKAGFRETENYGRLKHSFYKLARGCGIEMPECSVIEENGLAHLLTKRFARKATTESHATRDYTPHDRPWSPAVVTI